MRLVIVDDATAPRALALLKQITSSGDDNKEGELYGYADCAAVEGHVNTDESHRTIVHSTIASVLKIVNRGHAGDIMVLSDGDVSFYFGRSLPEIESVLEKILAGVAVQG